MSDFNTPIKLRQGGTVLEVGAGGTINILAGGSIQNAGANSNSGSVTFSGSLSVTGVIGAPALTLGGTLGRWSFGTSALTAGLGTIATGLNRVVAANAVTVLGEPPSAGSALFVLVDLSLSASGSVIYRAGSANGQFGAGATVSWAAFGT